MNEKQYQYVQILAEQGSFSRAAEELKISQPSLSQYIKKIETQLGTDLFRRANGDVRLTDAGRVFLDTGCRVLELERQMEAQLRDIREEKSGTVIVGAAPFRSVTLMPAAAAAFRERYPNILVTVEERTTAELMVAAERGEVDLCVMTRPVDERLFCMERIMEEELVLAVPTGSELQQKLDNAARKMPGRKHPAVDAKLLNGAPFVMVTPGQSVQQYLKNLCLECGITVRPSVVVKCLEALTEMVHEGMGAALVPISTERYGARDGRVTYYSVRQVLPKQQLTVIWRRDRYLSAPERELVRILKEVGA